MFVILAGGTARAASGPTREACIAATAHARAAAAMLPAGSMSRTFAESFLVQAKSEAGNEEFDDCLDYAAKAEDEARHPHHLAERKPSPKTP